MDKITNFPAFLDWVRHDPHSELEHIFSVAEKEELLVLLEQKGGNLTILDEVLDLDQIGGLNYLLGRWNEEDD